jgi:hypothetical protein
VIARWVASVPLPQMKHIFLKSTKHTHTERERERERKRSQS